MPISRNNLSLWFRPELRKWSALVSFALFAVLPLVCLVALLGGGLASLIFRLFVWLLWLIPFAIFGLLVRWGAQAENKSKGIFWGLVFGVIGFIVSFGYITDHQRELAIWAEGPFRASQVYAHGVFTRVFIGKGFVYLAWLPLSLVLLMFFCTAGVILLLGAEWIFQFWLRRARPHCDRCPSRTVHHLCPNGHVIEDLRPSRYGLFVARCATCGEAATNLPTLDILGRSNLPRRCGNPECSNFVEQRNHAEGHGLAAAYTIGLVGAVSSGKTNFCASAIELLLATLHNTGFGVSFANAAVEARMRDYFECFHQGRLLDKTRVEEVPTSVLLHVSRETDGQRQFVASSYFYDVSGEELDIAAGLARQYYHDRLDGLVFILDPFAEESIVGHLGITPAQCRSVNAAKKAVAGLVETVCDNIRTYLNLRPHSKVPVPTAVVMMKSDALAAFRPSLLSEEMDSSLVSPQMLLSTVEEHSAEVRSFLRDNGMHEFVTNFEKSFANVRYFAAGVFPPSGSLSYEPRGILRVALWLFRETPLLGDSLGARFVVSNIRDWFWRAARGLEGSMAQISFWAGGLFAVASILACGWILVGFSGLVFASIMLLLFLVGASLWLWTSRQAH